MKVTIHENTSLQGLNTFGIEAYAKYLAHITTPEGLGKVVDHSIFKNSPRLVLGGGSNILFTKDYEGLILKVDIQGIQVVEESNQSVLIQVGAGENWHQFVLHCIHHEWGGIENLSLIPGTVGAAPIQNIGAYGAEVSQVIEYVDGVDLETGKSQRFNQDECKFGYRESVFKVDLRENIFISSVTLRLTKKKHQLDTRYGAVQDVLTRNKIVQPTIRDISDAVISIRQSKLPDPAVIGNAGSFFKNPPADINHVRDLQKQYPSMPVYPIDNQNVKIPAGWLIEQCGWKGKRIGNVGVHEKQALVLVNFGGGKGGEIFHLATKIQESVFQKFGISLSTEVNII